jgi:hypothetical protein
MALLSTQPLTHTTTRNTSWWGWGKSKGSRFLRLTLPLPYADCLEIWEPQHPGNIGSSPGLYGNSFTYLGVFLYEHNPEKRIRIGFKMPLRINTKKSKLYIHIFIYTLLHCRISVTGCEQQALSFQVKCHVPLNRHYHKRRVIIPCKFQNTFIHTSLHEFAYATGFASTYSRWWYIFNCSWVATRWQLFSTHVHTNNTGNVTRQTIHRITQKYIEQHNN